MTLRPWSRAAAAATGSMLEPPMSTPPATTAWTALSPEPKFCTSTSIPCFLKKPFSSAITTSTFAKLVWAVGRPTVIPPPSPPEAPPPAPWPMPWPDRSWSVPPHAATSSAASTLTAAIALLIGPSSLRGALGLGPGREAPLGRLDGLGQQHAERHQHDHGHHHAVGAELVRLGDDHVAEAGERRVELGHDDAHERAADRQPDPGDDVGQRGGDDQVAPHPRLARAEGLGHLLEARIDLPDAGGRVDQHGEDREQEEHDDLRLDAEPEPEHEHRNERHHGRRVECDRRHVHECGGDARSTREHAQRHSHDDA